MSSYCCWLTLCIVEQEWGRFDVVLAADCLFFRDFHEALLQLLPRLLRPHGSVLLLQPRRGDSLELFLHKMTQRGELQLVAMDQRFLSSDRS
mmetsp:Transcript_26172/g.37480  ORF Transcript_26172/g.37480 Transcript_26172/m.37480 type:complete len:92 (+) Transcript_26172:1055-1330(+)